MYRLYCAKCREDGIQPQNEKFYRTIFNSEFNIGFHHPKKDDCNFCTSFKNSSVGEKANNQSEYDAHHARKERVRQLKKSTGSWQSQNRSMFELSHLIYSKFYQAHPCQSVHCTISESVYNQTVYNLANHNVDWSVWHEGTAGRGSSKMASCLYNFMKSLLSIT